MGRVLTLLYVGYYIPDMLFYFSPCGTKSHTLLTFQVTWTYTRRRIGRGEEHGASIACACGPPAAIKTRGI